VVDVSESTNEGRFSTSSTSFVDIPDMNVTFTTEGGPVLLSTPLDVYSTGSHVYFRYLVDGAEQPHLWQTYYQSSQYEHVNYQQWLLDLAPGTHTVQLQGRVSNGSMEILGGTGSEFYNSQQLRVVEFNSVPGAGPVVDVSESTSAYYFSTSSSYNFVNIPDMNVTFTTDGGPVLLSTPLDVYSYGSYVKFRYLVDGVEQPHLLQSYGGTGQYEHLNYQQWLLDLAPGTHTVQLQGQAGSGYMVIRGGTGSEFWNSQQLRVVEFNSFARPLLDDNARTGVTTSQTLSGLEVHREVTVPDTGNEDFARTVDSFYNPTHTDITTTVKIVGNLGSDAATMVFATSDGDSLVEATDQWIGTDDVDGSGTPAIIHYLHGPDGLKPTAVNVIDDNIEWTYDLAVPAGSTVRLAHFTILADTQAEAVAAAAALVTATDFGGEAASFLSQAEQNSILNYFDELPTVVGVQTGDGRDVNATGVAERNTTQIVVNFSESMLGGGQASNFELRRAGADALLGTADDPMISVTPEYSGQTATLSFSSLREDVYRLTVFDTFTDATLNSLDGDADGVSGGEFVLDFVVDTPNPPEQVLSLTPDVNAGGLVAGSTTLEVNFSGVVAGGDQAPHYELRGAGSDGFFDTADDVLIALSASYSGTTATLTFDPLPLDQYRFTVKSGENPSTISGGSTLLSGDDLLQLEAWLGESRLTLTNIFTKTSGDGQDSSHFHAAADGQGRTFSIIEVLPGAVSGQVIGGYNPLSWNSSATYNYSNTDAERTAFLFNLDTLDLQHQKLSSVDGNVGRNQTYNNINYGPTFGSGHDLYVNTSLNSGYAQHYSYGNPGPGNKPGAPNIVGTTSGNPTLTYGTIEVFTVVNAGEGLIDLLGYALDGNADGMPGGDFVVDFTAPPVQVLSVTPDVSAGGLTAGSTTLEVNFSGVVAGGDQALHYELRGAGSDGFFDTADDVLIALSVSYSGTTATLTFDPLPLDQYRFTVKSGENPSTISGGSILLSADDLLQLETWLGESRLTLTNIFTKTSGDGQDSNHFHAAADGQGRTFSVIEVLSTQGNALQVIGGYNPLSWNSSWSYNYSNTDAERTAFIFNLDTLDLQRQKLSSVDGDVGVYQTYNYSGYGPTFGGGHDIVVYQSLASGYANHYSYGAPGTSQSDPNIIGRPYGGSNSIDYGTIEVFMVANAGEGLIDLVGNALDGDADGIAGGDYIIDFTAPPVQVMSVTPDVSAGGLTAGSTTLEVNFSGVVAGGDQALHYELRGAGSDGSFNTADDVLIALSASYSGTTATLTFNPLPLDQYRFTVKSGDNPSTISGGSSLLSADDLLQLEAWLGESRLTLTNIFTKTPGDGQGSTSFYGAANGQGRTFSIIEVLPGAVSGQVIGGYNPQSWKSSEGYHITTNDADRTAFIFNLDTLDLQRQKLSSVDSNVGQYQTWNGDGPTFGYGHDLYINSILSSGYAYHYSYGNPGLGNQANAPSIVGITSPSSNPSLTYGTIEVFTISVGGGLFDLVGNPLDGDADGIAGGDYIIGFAAPPVQVVSVTPDVRAGGLTAGSTTLEVNFSGVVTGGDQAPHYELRGAGSDGSFNTADDVLIDLSASYSGTTARLTFDPLPLDQYRFTVKSGDNPSTISGGSTLLSGDDLLQLEAWLGEGHLILTNIFTKTSGDGKGSSNFHAAVDGQGRTFSVIEVLPTQGNAPQVIGGYNPQSWNASYSGYHITENDADRTAFIFNLDTLDLQHQKIRGLDGNIGRYQTYNNNYYGPTFGGGHDLYIDSNLNSGYARHYSYGAQGDSPSDPNIIGRPYGGGSSIDYGTIEVFTISAVEGLIDLVGNPLDGDADGIAGGDYIIDFAAPPVQVVSITPDFRTGGLTAGSTTLDVNFSGVVTGGDQALHYELRGAGIDGSFDTADDVLIALSASYSGTTATLTFNPLPSDQYRFTVKSDEYASIISGGSSLLSADDLLQLEAWLGEDHLTLTNIFTKTPGDGQDSYDFHAAVDGRGRTFSIIEVLPGAVSGQVIGGYNPQSWNASGWHITENDADRTAFLFNLDTLDLQRQKLGSLDNNHGRYQTYNYYNYGPVFGSGHDLYIYNNLSSGHAYHWSYGNPGLGNRTDAPSIVGTTSGNPSLTYGTIEVFTISVGGGRLLDLLGNALDGDADGIAGGDFVITTNSFNTPGGFLFDPEPRGFGAGQFVQGLSNSFDGLNRLRVDGRDFTPQGSAREDDFSQTLLIPMQTLSGLNVSREITVPNAGIHDFARTLDVFHNPTASEISTTVTIVGNLGSADTVVFNTSDFDTGIEVTDQWIGTDDADGTGSPTIVHYIRSVGGIQPTAIGMSGDLGDNVEWSYQITVGPGETVRLAHFTILADTRIGAEEAAAALVMPDGFGGEADAFLTQDELASVVNFVFNRPPVSDAGGPYIVDEGRPLTLDGTASTDPDENIASYEWDLDDDGQFDDATGPTPEVTFVDDFPTRTIALRVTDDYGEADIDTTTLRVDNVAPIVNAGTDATIDEGDAFSRSGSFTDPGADMWSATVDYGDSTGAQPLALLDKGFTLDHVYADNGTYIATVTVDDGDGGVGSDTFMVTVYNVLPTLDAGLDQTVNEGTFIILDPATFSDPGFDNAAYPSLEDFTATIDWGDGTTEPAGDIRRQWPLHGDRNGSGRRWGSGKRHLHGNG
jgi:uncharacterized protein YgfB (UPF0149 family)